jgi:perosamine synthetase
MTELKKIDWWSVQLGETEIQKFQEVIRRGYPNEGPVTEDLQDYFKDFFGVKYAFLTTSGTIAIYLALKARGIGPGDRVAVPNLTFIATANAVSLCGATPVLIDVLSETLCIDPDSIQIEHKKNNLAAVIPVHVSGRSAINTKLVTKLKELGIPFIEDAAEAFGSRNPITSKYLGTEGIAGAFSFSPNKIVTSGQGGLVVTNDDDLAMRIRELKDQGRPQRGSGGDDIHNSVGFNFKYTDLQASVLQGQLTKLDSRIKHLTNVYEFYKEFLHPNSGLMNFQTNTGEFPLWPEIYQAIRSNLENSLDKAGIGYRRIWHPLSRQDPYLQDDSKFPVSVKLSQSILWLPSSFSLDLEDLRRIVNAVNDSKGEI